MNARKKIDALFEQAYRRLDELFEGHNFNEAQYEFVYDLFVKKSTHYMDELIKLGVEVNKPDTLSIGLLYGSVDRYHFGIFRTLIAAGININEISFYPPDDGFAATALDRLAYPPHLTSSEGEAQEAMYSYLVSLGAKRFHQIMDVKNEPSN